MLDTQVPRSIPELSPLVKEYTYAPAMCPNKQKEYTRLSTYLLRYLINSMCRSHAPLCDRDAMTLFTRRILTRAKATISTFKLCVIFFTKYTKKCDHHDLKKLILGCLVMGEYYHQRHEHNVRNFHSEDITDDVCLDEIVQKYHRCSGLSTEGIKAVLADLENAIGDEMFYDEHELNNLNQMGKQLLYRNFTVI